MNVKRSYDPGQENDIHTMLGARLPSRTLEVPVGAAIVSASGRAGKKVVPEQVAVEVQEGQTVTVVFTVLPATHLALELYDHQQESFAHATLISADGKISREFPARDLGLPVDTRYSYLLPREGQIVGLEEGRWRLEVKSVGGKTIARDVELSAGSATSIKIQW